MSSSNDNFIPADLAGVVERLSEEKPELSAMELDAVKQQARRQAARRASAQRQKGSIVKSRIAVASMLVLGALMSAGGVGMAAVETNKSASAVQYDKPVPLATTTAVPTPQAQVAPAVVPSVAPLTLAPPAVSPSVAPSVSTPREARPANDVRPAAQAAADDPTRLPFTGFAAIPVLLGGLGLLAGGLVVRTRMSGDES